MVCRDFPAFPEFPAALFDLLVIGTHLTHQDFDRWTLLPSAL
jgi:hypothetical protein